MPIERQTKNNKTQHTTETNKSYEQHTSSPENNILLGRNDRRKLQGWNKISVDFCGVAKIVEARDASDRCRVASVGLHVACAVLCVRCPLRALFFTCAVRRIASSPVVALRLRRLKNSEITLLRHAHFFRSRDWDFFHLSVVQPHRFRG
jgi:hypothetical protein